uniref:Putative methyltransferase n=1 Tax=viral metagenome TaxID=1070528 RepID=A0A6M3K231_9ZZZZ
MIVVHYAEMTPHACGLYHTTKDLVKAEIGQGIDAHFVDIRSKDGVADLADPGKKDGWLTSSDPSVADDADILVRHTSIPNEMENSGIPVVMAMHGRPESSLLLDEKGEIPVIEAFYNKGQDCRYKAFFTFWKEHLPFWGLIVPEKKLHYVPAMVDLMEWRPGGEKFDLGEHAGNPNILIADIWRDDVTPFKEVMAVAEWIKKECPTARLHIAAAPTGKGANVLWRALRKQGVLGYACGQTKDIKALYEACDVVVSPHQMATRIVREGHAMGKLVIGAADLSWWLDEYKESSITAQKAARKHAEVDFRLSNAGEAAKTIYEGILNEKPTKRKVFIDIGGHLGETVRRFYREVEDARFWEIHSFEPHPVCFRKLCEVTRRMKNVSCYETAMVGHLSAGSRLLFPGNENVGEGSTFCLGKTTGKVDYTNPLEVVTTAIGEFLAWKIQPTEHGVVLKMNIEGAEYELMKAILDENLIVLFSQIYIQTHKHKLHESAFEAHKQLEERFSKAAQEAGVQVFMTEKGMAKFQCSQS